jgi:hypothetical protein
MRARNWLLRSTAENTASPDPSSMSTPGTEAGTAPGSILQQ